MKKSWFNLNIFATVFHWGFLSFMSTRLFIVVINHKQLVIKYFVNIVNLFILFQLTRNSSNNNIFFDLFYLKKWKC